MGELWAALNTLEKRPAATEWTTKTAEAYEDADPIESIHTLFADGPERAEITEMTAELRELGHADNNAKTDSVATVSPVTGVVVPSTSPKERSSQGSWGDWLEVQQEDDAPWMPQQTSVVAAPAKIAVCLMMTRPQPQQQCQDYMEPARPAPRPLPMKLKLRLTAADL